MPSVSNIEHKGTIETIKDNKITVRFTALSACASCHARSYCSASEMEDKIVEVNNSSGEFSTGESVNINLALNQGFKALLIGYVYPFLVVFVALVILSVAGVKELFAGLLSLSLLVPYYLVVAYLKKDINKKFQFTIQKILP